MRNYLNKLTTAFAVLLFGLVIGLPVQAGSKTNYLEDALIGHLFRGSAYTAPSTLYISLHTAACSDSSTGTEVTGGSYARVGVANSAAQWDATVGGNGTTANTNAITFPSPTADWGQATHFGIFDASSAGNMLVCQALTTAKTINNGDPAPSFAAGALTYQEDN